MKTNKRFVVWIQSGVIAAGMLGQAAFAQAPAAQAPSDSQTTVDIVKELDAMKQRMAQLEAALQEQRKKEEAAKKEAAEKAALEAKAAAEAKAKQEAAAAQAAAGEDSTAEAARTVKQIAATPAGHVPEGAERDAEPPQETAPAGQAAPAAPATPPVDLATPFAYADYTWMNSIPRNHDSVLDGKYFSGEFRVDTNYMYDYEHPIDHTLIGTTEGERTGEFIIQALNAGGDFHAGNMQGRMLTQFGAVSTAVPRNDASYSQGQWDLADAYRYLTEMYGGWHINYKHGLNIQVGDFLSFIGLFSYYSFDNWMYQQSYVSSNTPWFFTGMRAQWFPTNKLKIEPWLINGWQTYAKYNGREGVGGQILYRPTGNLDFV